MIETKVKFSEEVFNVSVEHLKLPVRPRNCLRHATGIKTVGDLVQKTESELLELHAFGPVSLKQVKHVLAEIGLRLGMHVPQGDPDEPKGRTARLRERHLDMATVIDQRDEARRMYCRAFVDLFENPKYDELSLDEAAALVAEDFGWDCFEEETK
jgi:hypothetical protein